jgi:hypothetical protein
MKKIILILLISFLFVGCNHLFNEKEIIIIKPLDVEGQVLHVFKSEIPTSYKIGYINSHGEYVEAKFKEYQIIKNNGKN